VENSTFQSDNPLLKYVRSPQIYIKLPSNGQYYGPGALDMPINGELPVLAMNSYDELSLQNPDALLNGQAVVNVIQSCIPNIKNAWLMPVVDLDTCLIAIRIATYGEEMQYSSTCPQCSEFNEYGIDLRGFLDMPIKMELYEQLIHHDDLQFKLKPINYFTLNNTSMETFENQRLANVILDESLTAEVRQQKFNEIYEKLTKMNLANVLNAVEYVKAGDIQVTDPKQITDFLQNADARIFNKVKKHYTSTQEVVPEKEINTTCPDCQHAYSQSFTFDHANFFESAS